MLAYSDALRDMADWYRQLWAESLGKNTTLDGRKDVFMGQTPIKSLGVTDQHSQLQLYLEGPNDKLITVLALRKFQNSLTVPKLLPQVKDLGFLRGQTMNRLMESERKATIDALREANRPVITVTFPHLSESTVAEFLYMLEVETAMAGRLFNVNAFDQPGVERIKVLTKKYMGGKRG